MSRAKAIGERGRNNIDCVTKITRRCYTIVCLCNTEGILCVEMGYTQIRQAVPPCYIMKHEYLSILISSTGERMAFTAYAKTNHGRCLGILLSLSVP
jgi:hypothetical protein